MGRLVQIAVVPYIDSTCSTEEPRVVLTWWHVVMSLGRFCLVLYLYMEIAHDLFQIRPDRRREPVVLPAIRTGIISAMEIHGFSKYSASSWFMVGRGDGHEGVCRSCRRRHPIAIDVGMAVSRMFSGNG